VNLAWAALIVVGATVVAVAAMLLARRRAPEGSHFQDGDRAAGVFGVLATGFAVLLGFVVFLSFESFDTSRSGAEDEALVVAQQFETAQFLPVAVRGPLSGQLVCYARYVIHEEWPAMQSGTQEDSINPWGVAMFRTLKTTEPRAASEQSAYDKWLEQVSERESARIDRTHGAEGVIPTTLWIVLFLSAAVIFVFIVFFADPGEHAVVQGMIAGSVTVVISATLLLLWFLDNPYQSGVGGLEPTAMERTLRLIDEASDAVGLTIAPPCDENGVANGG
jgi:hypothetical protein